MDFRKEPHEVLQTAAQPVHGPRGNHVEASASGVFAHSLEGGSRVPGLCARHRLIGVDPNDLPVGPLRDDSKLSLLIHCRLGIGTHAGVDRDSLGHAASG